MILCVSEDEQYLQHAIPDNSLYLILYLLHNCHNKFVDSYVTSASVFYESHRVQLSSKLFLRNTN